MQLKDNYLQHSVIKKLQGVRSNFLITFRTMKLSIGKRNLQLKILTQDQLKFDTLLNM